MHQRPAGLDHHRQDPLVLLADRLGGVEQHDRDLGRLDRAGGAQGRVVLGAAGLADPLAQAGGVDELPGLAADLHQAVDRVDGGAGDRVDDRALLPGQPVEQAGLADVGPADQRDPARAARRALDDRRRRSGSAGEDRVEQVAGAAAVQRRDRVRLAQAERPQRRRPRSRCRWLSALLATRITGLSLRRSIFTAASSTSVAPTVASTTKSTTSAVCDGDLGLGGDGRGPVLGVGLPAAGVDDGEPPAGPLRVVGHPVAGHARARPRRPPGGGR